ncbi:MAG: type II toxin-antitoxin system RatA family toxin [Proteobacteria bacterium]|nr:type II toxin-antitoxin system RatA family toxin [Pseudomonadota bacterium]
MPSHSETRVVPYTADLMYRVVADAERYPDFLPWVVSLRVLSRAKEGEKDVLSAEMLVGFSALRERYTSRVVCDPVARTINVTQVEGVFRKLDNHWRFTPEGNGCRIDFSLDFEFKSRLLTAVAGTMFAHAATQMSHAFEARAKKLSEQPHQ